MLFDLLFDLCNCAYVRNNKRGGLKNLSLNNVVRRGFCGCHITFHPNSTFCLLFRLSIHVFVVVFVFTMLCCEQEQDFSRSYAACTMKSIYWTCFFVPALFFILLCFSQNNIGSRMFFSRWYRQLSWHRDILDAWNCLRHWHNSYAHQNTRKPKTSILSWQRYRWEKDQRCGGDANDVSVSTIQLALWMAIKQAHEILATRFLGVRLCLHWTHSKGRKQSNIVSLCASLFYEIFYLV